MKNLILATLISVSIPAMAASTGPYEGTVSYIKSTDIGSAYNTVTLNLDVNDSPCPSTNELDRFTMTSEVQHTAALSALLSGKVVRIYGNGVCDGGVEQISSINLFGDK